MLNQECERIQNPFCRRHCAVEPTSRETKQICLRLRLEKRSSVLSVSQIKRLTFVVLVAYKVKPVNSGHMWTQIDIQ